MEEKDHNDFIEYMSDEVAADLEWLYIYGEFGDAN